MTVIILTFAYNFTKNVEKEKKGKIQSKKEKKGKNKDNKIDTTENLEEEQKQEEIKKEELTTVVDVKKPIRFLHIEYNLLPGKFIYKIDVVFWGTVAKVYTKDGTKAMKSINNGGHYWIAFSIEHKVVLEDDDLFKLKSHVVNLSVSTNKNKLCFSEAKKDAETTFYFEAEAIDLKLDFAEAFKRDPNLNLPEELDLKTRNINDIKYILNDLLDFPTKTEPISNLHIIPDMVHRKKVLYIIKRIGVNNEVVYGVNDIDEPINVNDLLAKKGKKKGGKKEKGKGGKGDKNKVKKVDFSQISISGETFLTTSMITVNLKLINNELQNGFAFIEIKDVMTAKQTSNLHPLIIKVNKIVNIPKEVLEKHGFSFLYVSYDLCGIKYITGGRPILNETYFVDSHIYFLNEEQLKQIAEIIQNSYVIFQIYGIRLKPPEKPARMFGEDINDKLISEPLQNNQTEVRKYIEGHRELSKKSVLLAIARVRINELLHPVWKLKKLEPCIHPRYIRHLDETYNEFEKITPNTLNIEYNNIFDQNPLTENVLITYGMSIHISIHMLTPITSILNKLIEYPFMYNRILLNIYSVSISKSLLFNLFIHNAHWLQRKYVVPNYLSTSPMEPLNIVFEKNVITGWCISCIDHCLMFLEGSKQWIYKLIWCTVRRERKHALKVVYNSNYVHEKRLYMDMVPYGGVYFAPMHCSPYQLLIHNKTFTKGYLPEPVRRALQKLDLIRKCTVLEELPENLLPTTKELLSLRLEWSVPFHWPISEEN